VNVKTVILFLYGLSAVGWFAVAEPGLQDFPHWDDTRLAGTGIEALPVDVEPVFPSIKWDNPLYMVRLPDGSHQYLVVERWGRVWLLNTETGTRECFLDFAPGQPKQRRYSSSGITLHPSYPAKPFVYLHWNEKVGGAATNRVSRFVTRAEGGLIANPESREDLLVWASNGHNGGDLLFGPDGYLYVTSGDGATPGDPYNVGQRTDDLLSSILRIDVDHVTEEKPYRVPDDNPFVNEPGVTPEVWAYGLRNPWRMCFDPRDGTLWLGDNGDEHWEMVYRVERGANYGWSAFEGSHIFRSTNQLQGPTRVHTLPVVEHSHDEMRSVIGGFWYRGAAIEALKGQYIYGCYLTGKVWAFTLKNGRPTKPSRIADTGGGIVGFTEDVEGELYVVTMDRGIFKLIPSVEKLPARPFPSTLSATGLLADSSTHKVSEGMLPYEINAPMWWNGAERERFVGLPEDLKVDVQHRPPGLKKFKEEDFRTLAGMDRWKMPSGTVFMQTFSKFGRRVETQVSFKDSGEWRFLTYHWRNQKDAELVPEEGRTIELEGTNGEVEKWRFGARVDCAACHTQRSMFVLGFNYAQLNRTRDYTSLGGTSANQLETFHHLGMFRPSYKLSKDLCSDRIADPGDPEEPLDSRARAYLHVNCAHCHRETGLGGRAAFELLHWWPTEDLGILNMRPLVGTPGFDPEHGRLLVPKQPDRSEIYRRMAFDGPGHMPLLGGTQLDDQGIQLIRDWIEGM